MTTVGNSLSRKEPFWLSLPIWGKVSKLKRQEALDGILMALPWMLGFVVFTAGPMLMSAFLAVTQWDIISPPIFVGLKNIKTMISGDELFWKSLSVTVRYTLMSVPIHVVLGFCLAALLNSRVPGRVFFRSVFYLPSVLPVVASAVLWSWIFNPEFGLINYALSLIGVKGPGWLASEEWALLAIVIMNIQFIGFTMVIFLAALQKVPVELIEAAKLDGANNWQLTRYVTIPMISSVILLAIIININNSFQTFTQAYIMTNGGPSSATLFYMLHLYNNAFRYFKMGYASALAWVLFAIIVFFTIIQFRLSRLWVYTEE
jgi:multiple sugar transport system permease protein